MPAGAAPATVCDESRAHLATGVSPGRPGPLIGFTPADAERILAHLVALDGDDRFLRFGYGIGNEGIASYVARMDFALDRVHGLTDASGRIVALAHMAIRDGEVDFGLSVAPAWRRRGLGRILFAHVVELASLLRVQRVLCHSISPVVLQRAGACGFRRAGGNPAAALVLDIPVG